LTDAKLIDEEPLHDTMGVENSLLVAPGDPQRSILYRRITTRGVNQMPPTSTNLVDTRGAKLLMEWIRRLPRSTASEARSMPPLGGE
jgi:hypothetical protein